MRSSDRARVQGWHSYASQQERFQALCQPLALAGKSVLDIGCGYGDLKRYLDKQKISVDSYLGIDQQSAFIKSARQHFINSDNTDFIKADFSNITLPKADIVIASGSLNYRSRQANHYQQLIIAMYESSYDALAFNLLDSRYCASGKLLISYDPQEVLKFCRSICTNSQLFDHYTHNDFTIIMKR